MDNKELKVIMNSLYGFTATQLVQQVSAINALERTLEDIKKGASWQSLDLCIDSAISTLETIKNTQGINSERSENPQPLNIDRIRTMTAKELAYTLAKRYFGSNTDYVYNWLMTKYTGFDMNYAKKMHSEHSESSQSNIDYIRSLSVEELAGKIKDIIGIIEEGKCGACPFFGFLHSFSSYEGDFHVSCTYEGIVEWLRSEHSERSEKEDN